MVAGIPGNESALNFVNAIFDLLLSFPHFGRIH